MILVRQQKSQNRKAFEAVLRGRKLCGTPDLTKKYGMMVGARGGGSKQGVPRRRFTHAMAIDKAERVVIDNIPNDGNLCLWQSVAEFATGHHEDARDIKHKVFEYAELNAGNTSTYNQKG